MLHRDFVGRLRGDEALFERWRMGELELRVTAEGFRLHDLTVADDMPGQYL